MRRPSRFTLSTAFIALSVAAGCSSSPVQPGPQPPTAGPIPAPTATAPGSTPTSPGAPTMTATPTSAPASSTPIAASPTPKATSTPTATPVPTATPTPAPTGTASTQTACSAPNNALPGLYSSFFSSGTVSGSTYTQAQNGGAYEVFNYTAASPTPTTSPSAAPTTTPTPRAYYLYTGTYAIPSYTASPDPSYTSGPSQTVAGTTGCAFVLTTQDGSPIDTTSSSNANSDGFPTFAQSFNLKIFKTGPATVSVTLNASGGSGTIVLDNGVSGTISLTSRQQTSFARRGSPPTRR